ncbi:hypothetical protein KAT51_08285 [bacterium]|nr:hypothetical protein [bacterium]
MNLSALMRDLRKIDPKIRVSVTTKESEGAELVIPILRRTIKYDASGRKISDTIANLITGNERQTKHSTKNT